MAHLCLSSFSPQECCEEKSAPLKCSKHRGGLQGMVRGSVRIASPGVLPSTHNQADVTPAYHEARMKGVKEISSLWTITGCLANKTMLKIKQAGKRRATSEEESPWQLLRGGQQSRCPSARMADTLCWPGCDKDHRVCPQPSGVSCLDISGASQLACAEELHSFKSLLLNLHISLLMHALKAGRGLDCHSSKIRSCISLENVVYGKKQQQKPGNKEEHILPP